MNQEIVDAVKSSGMNVAKLLAFIDVETGGRGFDESTGKIMIQFEPTWFKKISKNPKNGIWSSNKVDKQSKEWEAFNDAYKIDPQAAMKSTSIGLGQIMGFNYKQAGCNSVDEMWNKAKSGIKEQVLQLISFVKSNKNLLSALESNNWDKAASIYNGSGYKALAVRCHRVPYDQALCAAYNKYKEIYK